MEELLTREEFSDELEHHGTKGMQWGRRLYQNKDGSLTALGKKRYNQQSEKLKAEEAKVKAAEKAAATKKRTQAKFDKLDAKKQELEERKKALKNGKKKDDDDQPVETDAQKKQRILNSTDPKEVYENRHLLTNNELNERVNRIDLEYRLAGKIPAEPEPKSGLDRMDQAKNVIDKSAALYKSVDGAVSTVANSYIGKTLANQLGLELPKKEKEFNLADFAKNINKKSAAEIKEVKERLSNENSILQEHNKRENKKQADADYAKQQAEAAKAKQKAQKEVDDYNKKWQKGESDDKVTSTVFDENGTYSKKGSDIEDSVTYVRDKNLPSVVGTKSYESGENYVSSNTSKFTAKRMSDADVEVIEPDWFTKMKKNGQV